MPLSRRVKNHAANNITHRFPDARGAQWLIQAQRGAWLLFSWTNCAGLVITNCTVPRVNGLLHLMQIQRGWMRERFRPEAVGLMSLPTVASGCAQTPSPHAQNTDIPRPAHAMTVPYRRQHRRAFTVLPSPPISLPIISCFRSPTSRCMWLTTIECNPVLDFAR